MHRLLSRLRFWWDHRWAPEHMSGYLDGDLAVRQRRRMERHVAECGACRRLLAGLRLVTDALHQLPAPEGGDGARIAASVRARIDEPR